MRKITAWDEELTHDETNVYIKDLALYLLAQVPKGTQWFEAQRQHLASCITTGNYSCLCDYNIDYSNPAWTAEQLIAVRQILAFYTKRENLDIGVDKNQVAWSTFMLAEEKCLETNNLFKDWASGKFKFDPDVESVLFRAQRKIAQVLGDLPNLEDLALRFGPGANTGINKRVASSKRKLSEQPTCSTNLEKYLDEILQELPLYTSLHATDTRVDEMGDVWETLFVHVVDSKVAFVPKSPKTSRTIGVEPLLNSMGQLAYGDYISSRLLRWGVDLSDQSRNQRLAREGSLTGALATLDLSSASDTIASELVFHLLPHDWAWQLSKYRSSHCTCPDGSRLKFEKFSSMGNGFTFPLETLIFWALATCATDDEVSVYGDDIICNSSKAEFLAKVLVACGFSVNQEKSYWSGPFRESCGSDYYKGIDIRPCYVKTNLACYDLFRLYNFFWKNKNVEICEFILRWIPKHLQLWGPDGYGDGHLHTDDPSFLRIHKRSHGWSGFVFDTFTFKSRRSFKPLPGDAILPFYTIYRRSTEPIWVQFAIDWESDFVRYFHRSGFRKEILKAKLFSNLDSILEPLPEKRGVKGVTTPGTRGYKRISIYTLNR